MGKSKKPVRLKSLPVFKTEDDEREFWAKHDSTDYIDWSKAEHLVLPNLKLSEDLLELKISISASKRLLALANERHVSTTTLARKYILEGLSRDKDRAGI